jgi:hypothetical protein
VREGCTVGTGLQKQKRNLRIVAFFFLLLFWKVLPKTSKEKKGIMVKMKYPSLMRRPVKRAARHELEN